MSIFTDRALTSPYTAPIGSSGISLTPTDLWRAWTATIDTNRRLNMQYYLELTTIGEVREARPLQVSVCVPQNLVITATQQPLLFSYATHPTYTDNIFKITYD
jgi:hypothetical protein